MKVFKYVLSDHSVNSFFTILSFTVKISAHGVGFSTSRLPVSKTSSHSSVENSLNERFGGKSETGKIMDTFRDPRYNETVRPLLYSDLLIYNFVTARVVESVIEPKILVIQIFS